MCVCETEYLILLLKAKPLTFQHKSNILEFIDHFRTLSKTQSSGGLKTLFHIIRQPPSSKYILNDFYIFLLGILFQSILSRRINDTEENK